MPHALRYLARIVQPLPVLIAFLSGYHVNAIAAQPVPGAASIQIDAGSLAQALDKLGEQTGVLIMYEPGLVQGLRAKAASGRMTPSEALTQLLAGSGLSWQAVNASTFVLRRVGNDSTDASRNREESARTGSAEASRVEDVLVVGSRLGAAASESAQPIVLISREEIERSGAATIAQVLSARPEVSVNNNGDNAISSGNFNATTVQLRGLPVGATLVLLNGRRIGNTGVQATLDFFDLNTLPLALVDHIEILPVGSSAVYGGDALAGVVNIVLSKNAQGLDLSARHAFADGYTENQFSLTWGGSWSAGSLTVSGTYGENSGLDQSERAITADKNYTRFGGSDSRSFITNPGNVFSLDGCPPAAAARA